MDRPPTFSKCFRSAPIVFRRFVLSLSLPLILLVFGPAWARSALADDKNFTAEQIVETTILVYGTRPGMAQVRRNGDERGRVTRMKEDGRTEEATYERRFVRGESMDKDKIRLDQKTPTIEYSLVTGGGRTWGIINGAMFTPREDASADFLAEIYHGIDSLLRYKENGSTIELSGKDKQQNVDVYYIDVTDKEKRHTKYTISAKTFRVLSLEYERPQAGATTTKFIRKFYDYRVAQGTLVPFRSVLYQDGKPIQESRVMTITYGVKMEDALFNNPDTPNVSSAQ